MKKNIVFYISGHGYGHAVRSAEVIFALIEKSPQTQIHIRTTAPEWLFAARQYPQIHVYPVALDVGAIQKNSFRIDIEATFRQIHTLFESWNCIAKQETKFICKNDIDLIVGDIPPLAFRLAAKLNIPAYAIGNFGWDWIYEDWLDQYPQFSDIVFQIKEDYSTVDLLFQLPASEPMHAFPTKIPAPLIARTGSLSKADMAKAFDLAENKQWMLLALPQYDKTHMPWHIMKQNRDWLYLSPFHDKRTDNMIPIPREGFRFSDLVGVSDVVLSKPGYGIVSDCFANRVPLLYIERHDFIEYHLIVQWLREHSIASEITFEQFEAGDWDNALSEISNRTDRWSALDVEGDRFIANQICESGP